MTGTSAGFNKRSCNVPTALYKLCEGIIVYSRMCGAK
jgi:hypothetical protein